MVPIMPSSSVTMTTGKDWWLRRARKSDGRLLYPERIRVGNLEDPRVYVPERTCHIDMPVIDWETGETDYKCSACGFSADPQDWAETYDHCPKCGARVVVKGAGHADQMGGDE